MTCATCGTEFSERAKFCANCGTKNETKPLPHEADSKSQPYSLKATYNAVGNAVNRVASATGNIASAVTLQVADLNGDGKIDEEDFKIAAERAKEMASAVGSETVRIGKDALKSDMVKDAAAGAAVGAVISIPIPLMGPAAGAAIGAALGVYKNFTKK